jgi:glutamate racemase
MHTPPAFLGIILLESQLPRPVGDIAHPTSFGVPVHLEVVRSSWPGLQDESVKSLKQARMVPAFQTIVRNLERKGAKAITTSASFLVLLQKDLQSVVRVPVVTSALLLLPQLLGTQTRVGVLSVSAVKVGKEHLLCAGVPRERLAQVVVQGLAPESALAQCLLHHLPQLDLAQAERDAVAAALTLKARAPDLQTIVLECPHLPPYAAAIEQATGCQVRWLKDSARLMQAFQPKPAA